MNDSTSLHLESFPASRKFSIGEAVRFGWNKMKIYFWFFVVIFLMVFAVGVAAGFVEELITSSFGVSSENEQTFRDQFQNFDQDEMDDRTEEIDPSADPDTFVQIAKRAAAENSDFWNLFKEGFLKGFREGVDEANSRNFFSQPASLAAVMFIIIVFLFKLVEFLLQRLFEMGYTKIAIRISREEKPEYSDVFSCLVPFKNFLSYIGATILYFLMVMVGLVLFIIPGIILALMFQYYAYFIIEDGVGPIEALKRSSEITRGSLWQLFLLSLVLIGINILGFLALLIGLLATIPTTMVAVAYVYQQLRKAAGIGPSKPRLGHPAVS